MRVVERKEMVQIEAAADAAGLGFDEMMEHAGGAVAEAVRGLLDNGMVLVLVGPGNNGGDGLVAAHYLFEASYDVVAVLWRRPETKEDAHLARLQDDNVPLHQWEDLDPEALTQLAARADIIVDSLLGTGAKGALRDDLVSLLAAVQEGLAHVAESDDETSAIWDLVEPVGRDRPLVVAVDLPSGLDADSGAIDERALVADVTVTFAYPKRGHYAFPGAAYVGELWVADIGIEEVIGDDVPCGPRVATVVDIRERLPVRGRDAHKGTFGRALVVGGSMNYVGAPALAALAAYRVGAGLVTLAVPQAIHAIVACQVVEATHIVLPHNLGALVPAAARLVREGAGDCEAILVGPGLGQEPETESFLKLLLGKGQETGRRHVGFLAEEKGLRMDGAEALPPLVLDADGLNLLARTPEWWTLLPEGSVLTPHPGEMARLMGCSIEELPSDRVALATQKASEWNCIVVLKGAFTVVASPTGEVWVLPFATAALSTAGSGDVLAGAIAGLLAQGLAPDDAALCGAYLHGYAGLLAERSIGRAGTIAGDLLPLLPDALSLAGEG